MDAQVLIGIAATVTAALIGVGRITWGVSRELRELRAAISELRLTIERNRTDEREWVLARIREHAAECPAREPTGVRSMTLPD